MSKEDTLLKWLPPKPKNRKKRVVIYDFDGTLVKSPDRDEGETRYFEATGQMFPFSGWWGRKETLMPPIFPDKPGEEHFIMPTVQAYREDAKCDQSELILMTGRPFKHRKRIIEILDHQNIKFHNHYFRGQPGQKGRDTLEIKINFIENDLIHEGLEILEIWEDRPEHISAFFNMGKRWKNTHSLQKIIIHDVFKNEKNTI